MKFKSLLIIFVFSLIFTSLLVLAQSEVDISQELSLGESIQIHGTGISYKAAERSELDKQISISLPEGSSLNLNGVDFKNIKANKNFDSFIRTDFKGNVLFADLTASEESIFEFEGEKYTLPLNGRIIFNDGEVSIYSEDGNPIYLEGSNSENNVKITGSSLNKPIVKINKLADGKKIVEIIGEDTVIAEASGFKSLNGEIPRVTLDKFGKIVRIDKGTQFYFGGLENKVISENLNLYYGEDFNYLNHKGENYIHYNGNEINMGGVGFKSKLTSKGGLFKNLGGEQYQLDNEKFSPIVIRRMEFIPEGGNINLEILSDTLYNPKLKLSVEGDAEIRNSGVFMKFKNGNLGIKEKKIKLSDEVLEPRAIDTEIYLLSENGDSRKFFVQGSETYFKKPSEEQVTQIETNVEIIKKKISKLESEKKRIMALSRATSLKKTLENIDSLDSQKNEIIPELEDLNTEINLARLRGDKSKEKELVSKRDIITKNISSISREINQEKSNPLINSFISQNEKIKKYEWMQKREEGKLVGIKSVGQVFGEVISTDSENSRVLISNFPTLEDLKKSSSILERGSTLQKGDAIVFSGRNIKSSQLGFIQDIVEIPPNSGNIYYEFSVSKDFGRIGGNSRSYINKEKLLRLLDLKKPLILRANKNTF